MNSSTDEQVVAIVERVRADVLGMARATAADEHLDLMDMPTEIRDVEAPQTARLYLARNLDALAEGRQLTADELLGARDRGTRRAQEDFPVGLLLHYWSRGVIVLWQRCVAAARAEESAGLTEIASRLFALQAQQLGALADAHHEARTTIDRLELGAAALAARLLIAGQDATTPAQQAGITLAPAYDVLAVSMGGADGEEAERPTARGVARQRKVLRVTAALDAEGPRDLLSQLTSDGGYVLLPRTDAEEPDHDRCRAVLALIRAAAGADCTAAVGFAGSRGAIPAAAEHAREVLDIVLRSGLPAGLHDVTSVPLGYQLSRPGAGREHLLRILDPLDRSPELLETLQALMDRDGDRGRTARALGVHPNTVNNRLVRIREMLGIDPVTTHGVVTLSTALTARQLDKENA